MAKYFSNNFIVRYISNFNPEDLFNSISENPLVRLRNQHMEINARMEELDPNSHDYPLLRQQCCNEMEQIRERMNSYPETDHDYSQYMQCSAAYEKAWQKKAIVSIYMSKFIKPFVKLDKVFDAFDNNEITFDQARQMVGMTQKDFLQEQQINEQLGIFYAVKDDEIVGKSR